jgi:hypothetical protein
MFEKRVINLCIFVLRALMGHSEKGLTLALSIIRRMSEAKPSWSNWFWRVACNVSWEFQEDVAKVLNLSRCGYCQWVVYHDQPHDFCEAKLANEHEQPPDDNFDDYAEDENDEGEQPTQVFYTEAPSGHYGYE